MSNDLFTLKRLCRHVQSHRNVHGTLPTLQDLERSGFSKEIVKAAVKKKMIQELYSDMTTGAVVKVYKVEDPSLV
jgi:hypothetical protein